MCGPPLWKRCSVQADRQPAGDQPWALGPYLVIQVGAGERVGGRRRDGRGGHVVDGLQRRSSFDARLSTGHGGHAERRRRDSKPGLGERTRDGMSAHAIQLLPGAPRRAPLTSGSSVCVTATSQLAPQSVSDYKLTTNSSLCLTTTS